MKITERPIIVYLTIAVTAFVGGVSAILYTHKLVRDEVGQILRFEPSRVGKEQVQRIGDVQIVWGKKTAVISKSGDFRKDVDLTFPDNFAEQPVVTIGISGNREDTFWAISEGRITTNGYHCRIGVVNAISSGGWQPDGDVAKGTDVQIDYTAVGRWR